MNEGCKYCGRPRPTGYAATCGASECQEADFKKLQAELPRGTFKQRQRAARARLKKQSVS